LPYEKPGFAGFFYNHPHMPEYEQLQNIINNGRRIVFFGGAGVSTESGIPDFRSADGLYSAVYKHPPEVMLSHQFFMAAPEEFYEFYINKMLYLDAEPNPCHRKLAELEDKGRLTAVVTQNVDGLHQKAGSRNVLELHGSVHRNYCMACGIFYGVEKITSRAPVPRCDCGGVIKPDVVLYGETLDEATMERATAAIRDADVLIIGGTSLGVYPAAGLCRYFGGNHMVLINKSPTPYDGDADLIIRDSIGVVFASISV